MNLIDYTGKIIRLTDERLAHIKEHPEMVAHTMKINETLTTPDTVIRSKTDAEVNLYFKYYKKLSIGDKYLCVVVKYKKDDVFIITAHFTDSIKKGEIIWKR